MPDSPYQPALIALASLLGDRLSTGASVLALHARDEAHTTPAMPDAVAFPQTTDEVADIVKICAAHGCPVIPFGIGTSLEGHVVPVHGGVSVDLSRMNAVLNINSRDMTATVEPGVTRTQLNGFACDRTDVHGRSGGRCDHRGHDGDPCVGNECRAIWHYARECHGAGSGAGRRAHHTHRQQSP